MKPGPEDNETDGRTMKGIRGNVEERSSCPLTLAQVSS